MIHFTALELERLALPGLQIKERAIQIRAKREAWPCQRRGGRGGGWEFPESVLPNSARDELKARASREAAKQALAVTAEKQQRQIAAVPSTALTARQRQVMEARAAILLEVDRRVMIDRVTVTSAIRAVATASALGVLQGGLQQLAGIANDRSDGAGRISERVIFLWRAARDQGGLPALAPQLTRQKEKLPEWFGTFIGYYAQPQKPTAMAALAKWRRDRPGDVLPSERQVRLALGKLGAVERQRGRMGAQAIKTLQAYKTRDTSELLPSSVYVADGKTYDAEIAHPIHGQPFRPELTTIIDAHTRKITGFSVSLDENRFGVLDALRVACCYAGIPALFYTDRGPGYINDTMTNALTGFLARLGITPMQALPYNSQAKGIIERLNRMWTEDAKQYDTFIGADMDKDAKKAAFKQTRKELAMFGASRMLPTWEDFRSNCLASIDSYNNTPHSGLPRIADPETGKQRFMTPNEMWDAAVESGFEAIPVSSDETEDLFRPWVIRKTTRCTVSWLDNSYFSVELEQFHGSEVIVAYDISDASKVWIREIDKVDGERQPGRLITTAAFEGNKTRYVPISYEQSAMEKRAKGRERRLVKKLDVVRQETRPTTMLEHAPVKPIIDVMPVSAPAPVLAAVGSEPKTQQANITFLPNGRPKFSTDSAWALWVTANPDKVLPSDGGYAQELLRRETTKELLRSAGVDLDALRSLARSAA